MTVCLSGPLWIHEYPPEENKTSASMGGGGGHYIQGQKNEHFLQHKRVKCVAVVVTTPPDKKEEVLMEEQGTLLNVRTRMREKATEYPSEKAIAINIQVIETDAIRGSCCPSVNLCPQQASIRNF